MGQHISNPSADRLQMLKKQLNYYELQKHHLLNRLTKEGLPAFQNRPVDTTQITRLNNHLEKIQKEIESVQKKLSNTRITTLDDYGIYWARNRKKSMSRRSKTTSRSKSRQSRKASARRSRSSLSRGCRSNTKKKNRSRRRQRRYSKQR